MADSAASSIAIRRASAADAPAVLSHAALAWPETEYEQRQEILQMAFPGSRDGSLVVVSAEKQGECCGSVAGRILPGKVANVLPPQVRGGAEVAAALLRGLDAELRAEGISLAQTLLAPDDASGAWLRDGGYEHAAD